MNTVASSFEAQTGHLLQEEVNALREIANQLGKKDWNLSVNSCNQNNPYFLEWNATNLPDGSQYNNYVLCNCSHPSGICHIQSMFLKGQDLDGILPPSLAKLPYIKQIDFTRNYLRGTIPREWATTKLESLAVTVNRLSGPIPDYLGNISTLRNVSLDSNMFYGSVPPELGKLDIRLSSNNFTGKLPDFQSWKKLNKLLISNLNGGASEFPQLEGMAQLKNLLLRSCNIYGEMPKYLSQLTKLQRLDLSFNNLEGEIQTDLSGLASLQILYLTNNSLTGKIPVWIKNKGSKGQIDLSYNNFSRETQTCRDTLNLFRSYDNNLEHNNCLGSSPCSEE